MSSLVANLKQLPPVERTEKAKQFWHIKNIQGLASEFQQTVKNLDKIALQKGLDDIEIASAKIISTNSFGTRVGPMIGLMGTLIPLGPALMALGAGDTGVLSKNLIVAFTTTVVGLLISGISYAMSLIRKNWYAQDLSDLDFIVSSAISQENKETFLAHVH